MYPAQVQTRAEGPDDVVGEIRLLGIPHEPNGDDLWTVQEHPANLNALATVALQNRTEGGREEKPGGREREEEEKTAISNLKVVAIRATHSSQDLPV